LGKSFLYMQSLFHL